jgi:hypothetical protein
MGSKHKYKYDPDDFKGMLGLTDELSTFYMLHETYDKEQTRHNWFALEKHWEDLFFTIKHRELEGNLTQSTAAGLREYVGDLLHDQL